MLVENDPRMPVLRIRTASWASAQDRPDRASRREASVIWFLASLASWALLIAAVSYFL